MPGRAVKVKRMRFTPAIPAAGFPVAEYKKPICNQIGLM